MYVFIIKRSQQLSLYRVAAVKRLPVHRYVVIFTFSGPLGSLGSDIQKKNTANAGARRR